jgi:hypothetical protein
MTLFDCHETVLSSAPNPEQLLPFCDESIPGAFYLAEKTSLQIDIEKRFAVMSGANPNCTFGCEVLYVDTAGGNIDASLVQRSISNLGAQNKLHLFLPDGFHADGRLVQIDCTEAGCEGNHVQGQVACPRGIRMVAPVALGQDGNFAEEFCPKASVVSVSPHELARGAHALVELTGAGFSPSNHLSLAQLSGTTVRALDVENVTWLDYDHITFEVTVPDDAPLGTYQLVISNSDDIDDTQYDDGMVVTAG